MNTENILEWREAMIQLPDNHFFDLMQLYLGKIKTPFNKQKLIEQLSSFLRKERVREAVFKSLDSSDIFILSAINEIPNATYAVLQRLFKTKYTDTLLYEKLLNAGERLLIYNVKISDNEIIYKINPLLQDLFEPLLSKYIFMLAEKNGALKIKEIHINDVMLAGIYSFCFHNDSILKNNGMLKKRFAEKLYQIIPCFSQNKKSFMAIFSACENLGLLCNTGEGFKIQKQKWQAFAALNSIEKKIYFIASSLFKMRKEALHEFAQMLIVFFNSFEPNCRYNKTDAGDLLFLLWAKYFSTNHLCSKDMEYYTETHLNEFIDIAVLFGLLCEDENLIYLNPEFRKNISEPEKPLLIDPSFEVTVLPDSNLTKLLDACECMEPISLQTTGRFEITKKACAKIFQQGNSSEYVCNILAANTGRKIPQNIYVTISEWYANFTSLSIYSGFVVSVSKEKENFFIYDTPLKKLIEKKLCDGIYFLNIQDIKEFEQAVSSGGLEFIFYKKKNIPIPSTRGFQKLNLDEQKNNFEFKQKDIWEKYLNKRCGEYLRTIKKLNSALKEKNFPNEEEKILNKRINRKAIIIEEQIMLPPVKLHKNEAVGLDFLGKLKIAELAIAENKCIEIYLNAKKGVKKILCTPLEIIKTESGADVTVITESEKEQYTISIAHIAKIKLIKTTILS